MVMAGRNLLSEKPENCYFMVHNTQWRTENTHPLVCHSDSQQTVGHRTPAAGSPVVRICLSERGVCGL